MIKKVVLLAVVLTGVLGSQQVTLVLHVPPEQYLPNVSMWSLDVTNNTRDTIDIFIYGEIRRSGEGILATGRTNYIRLMPGRTYHITHTNVVAVGNVDQKFSKFLRRGIIPEGTYTFCVWAKDRANRILGRDCETVNVLQGREIYLLSPDSGAQVITTPVFSWLPLRLPSGAGVFYALKVVRVDSGQSLPEAMRNNHPILEREHLNVTTFMYPADAPRLMENQIYAWKITAFDVDGEHVGESAIWTFSVLNSSHSPDTGLIDTAELVRRRKAYEDSLCLFHSECGCRWENVVSQLSNTHVDGNANGVYDGPSGDPLVFWAGTDVWASSPATSLLFPAVWVSNHSNGFYGTGSTEETYFTVFNIPEGKEVCNACMEISADDSAEIYLNGHFIGSFGPTWTHMAVFRNISCSYFHAGENVIKVRVISPIQYYIGAIYRLNYCLKDTGISDNVLRVDSTLPGDCGCLCCNDTIGMPCEIKVHVTDLIGECGCPIEPQMAELWLFRNGEEIFHSRDAEWMPDNPSGVSGWFVWRVPKDSLCEDTTRRICAEVAIYDRCGHSPVPEPYFEWSFTADASPPHISLVSPVCSRCNSEICHMPDSSINFANLEFYVDDVCTLDMDHIRFHITTSNGDNEVLTPHSPFVHVRRLSPGGYVVRLNLLAVLTGDSIIGPIWKTRYYEWINVSVEACDLSAGCMGGIASTCNCQRCNWRFCCVTFVIRDTSDSTTRPPEQSY